MAGFHKYTPVAMPAATTSSFGLLWEGDVSSLEDMDIQIWEIPGATGDRMSIRVTADEDGGYFGEDAVCPKCFGWTDTAHLRFAGSPVDTILEGDNSGDPPAPQTIHVQVTVYMESPALTDMAGENPTTFVISDISMKQGGVEVTEDVEPPPDPEPGTGVDFDEDGFGTDDELATYVRKYRIQRGASAEITGGATIGTCWVELKNVDPADPTNPANPDNDLFNPLNAAGAFYGKLRDGKPLWIGINADGAFSGTNPRGLFGGRTVDWTPVPQGGATFSPTVELTGEDCLGWYDRTPVRVSDRIGRSHAELRGEMLVDAGETEVDLASEILTMPLSSWDGSLLDGLEAINKVNGTRHFCKPEDDRADWYTYTTRNRQWRLDATVDSDLDAAGDHLTSTTGWRLSADTVINQQKATVEPVSFTPSSTVVWRATGLPYRVTSGHPKVLWVEFDDYVDAPVEAVNYTGTAPTVTLLPFGRTAKLTITSSGTTSVTSALIAGRLARRGNAVSVVEDDTASQAGTRGIRAGSEISGDFVGVLANAQGIAAHIVWRYGNPQFRPTATVVNWIPDQFEIDLFDIVSITVAELQMTSRLFEVVGLTHECDFAPSATDHLHVTTYVLQECAVQSDPGWFVLDTSELDDVPVLAY